MGFSSSFLAWRFLQMTTPRSACILDAERDFATAAAAAAATAAAAAASCPSSEPSTPEPSAAVLDCAAMRSTGRTAVPPLALTPAAERTAVSPQSTPRALLPGTLSDRPRAPLPPPPYPFVSPRSPAFACLTRTLPQQLFVQSSLRGMGPVAGLGLSPRGAMDRTKASRILAPPASPRCVSPTPSAYSAFGVILDDSDCLEALAMHRAACVLEACHVGFSVPANSLTAFRPSSRPSPRKVLLSASNYLRCHAT